MHSSTPKILHAPWCDPSRHVTTLWDDQHCRSERVPIVPLDDDGPHVSVERSAQQHEDGRWVDLPSTVLVEVEQGYGIELTPADALALARTLLSAHAIATGHALIW